MSTLHFLNYNNYQNRTLKGEALTSIASYTVAKSYSGINFNINDGINTTQVINDSALLQFNYDYCLVTDDNSNTITSKWFVHDAVWNRKHQWIVPLLRDVKADFYDMYKNKPFFCMKGLPADTNDILCFNSEGKQYNQILRNRVGLKQTSGQTGRYIIGFVDKTWGGGDVILQNYTKYYKSLSELPIPLKVWEQKYYDKYIMPVVNFIAIRGFSTYVAKYDTTNPSDPDAKIIQWVPLTRGQANTWRVPKLGSITHDEYTSSGYSTSDIGIDDDNNSDFVTHITTAANYSKNNGYFNNLFGYIEEDLKPNYEDYSKIDEFIDSVDGQPIRIGDQIYTITKDTSSTVDAGYMIPLGSSQKRQAINGMQVNNSNIWYEGSELGSMWGDCTLIRQSFTVTSTPILKKTINVPAGLTSNNPYNIFVIPESDYGKQFAGWFAAQYGATFLYDLQLFPYAPDYGNATDIGNGYSMYWASSDSKFGTCSHSAIATYSSMADKKVGANQDMCRIIAPNGASAWDFNPAAIGGVGANSIKYEFTLIPFNSYLHIFPYFGGIYGGINKVSGDKEAETRGLICTGPWSLPYSTNNWSTYQLNNSAYMDSFNRQIQNMTTMQDIEKTKEAANIILGSIQGGVSGAISGSLMTGGNPAGAAAGAIVGTVASAAGGMLDQYLNSKAREETINYTKDQFQYSLQNIKAQAQPLAHNSSITIGNSYWPIVELYKADIGTTPSPMRDYFLEDLKIHGWSMGITTTFATMKGRVSNNSRYISGYLLQVENAEDTHIANEIMKELNKGVYIDHV